jgi:hypothetical protein
VRDSIVAGARGLVSAGVLAGAFAASAPAHAHLLVDGLYVQQNDSTIAHVWFSTVTGSFAVPYGAFTDTCEVFLLNPDSIPFQPQPPPPSWLRSLITSPGAVQYDSLGAWTFRLKGLVVRANTGVHLRVWYDDHFDYTSPAIPAAVLNPTSVESHGLDAPGAEPIALWAGPSPAGSRVRLRYELLSDEPIEIVVVDAAGRLADRIFAGREAPGSHERWWDASGVESGIYFARVSTATAARAAKVVVVR